MTSPQALWTPCPQNWVILGSCWSAFYFIFVSGASMEEPNLRKFRTRGFYQDQSSLCGPAEAHTCARDCIGFWIGGATAMWASFFSLEIVYSVPLNMSLGAPPGFRMDRYLTRKEHLCLNLLYLEYALAPCFGQTFCLRLWLFCFYLVFSRISIAQALIIPRLLAGRALCESSSLGKCSCLQIIFWCSWHEFQVDYPIAAINCPLRACLITVGMVDE